MRRYQFMRRYLLTGETTVGEMDARDLHQVLESLNDYNRMAPGKWQYWIEPNQMNGRVV